MAARYGQKPQKLTLEGARVRITYQVGGKAVEEQVQTVVDCVERNCPRCTCSLPTPIATATPAASTSCVRLRDN